MFNAIARPKRYRSHTRNKSRRYSNAASRAAAKSAFTMHEQRLTAISVATVPIYDRALTITSSLIIAYLRSYEIPVAWFNPSEPYRRTNARGCELQTIARWKINLLSCTSRFVAPRFDRDGHLQNVRCRRSRVAQFVRSFESSQVKSLPR